MVYGALPGFEFISDHTHDLFWGFGFRVYWGLRFRGSVQGLDFIRVQGLELRETMG